MPNEPLDIRALNARAVQYSAELVAKAAEEDFERPTPCAGWTFTDLLAHMTAQHRGFAAAAAGNGQILSRWELRPIAGRDAAVTDYEFASDLVQAAFSPPEALERTWILPEFGDDPASPPTFPGRVAMGFHFIDYVVHGWDVAKTLGLSYEPDEELLEPALAIARKVPNGDNRTKQGAAFRPGTQDAVDDGSLPLLDRILLYLGRSPQWPDAS
jgi:uncharacterized protein (TIGR03086 family)